MVQDRVVFLALDERKIRLEWYHGVKKKRRDEIQRRGIAEFDSVEISVRLNGVLV